MQIDVGAAFELVQRFLDRVLGRGLGFDHDA